jgi:hypothetical protein
MNIIYLALVFLQKKSTIEYRGLAYRVITTVFKSLQSRMDYGRNVSILQNASKYAAHF